MTLNRLVEIGAGIKTTTYFKLLYLIDTIDGECGIARVAVFGMN